MDLRATDKISIDIKAESSRGGEQWARCLQNIICSSSVPSAWFCVVPDRLSVAYSSRTWRMRTPAPPGLEHVLCLRGYCWFSWSWHIRLKARMADHWVTFSLQRSHGGLTDLLWAAPWARRNALEQRRHHLRWPLGRSASISCAVKRLAPGLICLPCSCFSGNRNRNGAKSHGT